MSSRLAKNTFYLTFAAVGQKIIAFAYFLILARIMAPDLTGQYFLATSVTMIFSVVADFGITPVVIREIARKPADTPRIIRSALSMKMPLIVLAMAMAIITAFLLGYEPEIVQLIMITSIVLLFDALHLLFYGVLRGHQVLKYEALGMFSGQITTATVGGLSLSLYPNLKLLITALICGSAMNVLVSGSQVVKRFGWSILKPVYEKDHLIWLMKTAFPFALAAMFVKIYSYIDTVFISKMLGTVAVGIYAIAYKLTYAFQFLPLSFAAALYPNMSELVGKDEKRLNAIFIKALWYMGLLSVPIVLGIYSVADQLVLLAGSDYAEATVVLQTLIFVLIPIFLDFPVGSLLNASGRQKIKTAIMGATMVINVILNFLLIPIFGVLGAAYAAIGSFTFLFIVGLYIVSRFVKEFSFSTFIIALLPIIGSGLFMFVLVLALRPHVGWVAVIPVGAFAYLSGLLLTRTLRISDLNPRRFL